MSIITTKASFRDLYESQGEATPNVVRELLESKKVKPENFSLKEIWEAVERDKEGRIRNVSEALTSDMFPTITGEIINRKILDAYMNAETIGDMLCETVPSNMEIDTYAGFSEVEMPEEVLQTAPYKDSSMSEKYVTVQHQKFGRLLSVSEEAVQFDKTGQILLRAQRIGEKAALYREKMIVEGVQDINSNVFKPSGVATAFYRSSDNGVYRTNNATSASFGEAGINAALKLLHNMKDENGNFVLIPTGNLKCLVPFDLWTQAMQMVRSTLVPEGNENASNIFQGMFDVLTSPYITAKSATTWYIGDFKQDFVWSEVWPLQTFTDTTGVQAFERDIKARFKVRFYGQIAALQSSHSIKATA